MKQLHFAAMAGITAALALASAAHADNKLPPPPAHAAPAHAGGGPMHPAVAPGRPFGGPGPGRPGGPGFGHPGFEHPGGPGFGYPGGPHGFAGDHRFFAHRDFHRFDGRERRLWMAGSWRQACFGGRCGWWWPADGTWYFYPAPIYPYPQEVSGVVFAEPMATVATPVAAAPPMAVAPAAASQTRYYCDNPAGYYPAVQNCAGNFRPVAP